MRAYVLRHWKPIGISYYSGSDEKFKRLFLTGNANGCIPVGRGWKTMDEDYTLLPRSGEMPGEAGFCLRLDNDCMEPFIKKGALIYIDRRDTPEEMQPGLFYYKGRVLCRQWCEDSSGTLYLLCANPKRESENLSLGRAEKGTCLCLGRVILDKKLPMPVYQT